MIKEIKKPEVGKIRCEKPKVEGIVAKDKSGRKLAENPKKRLSGK